MIKQLRKFLWRILGFDYQMLLDKTDYVLLKNDKNTRKGTRTYDNGAKVWRWTDAPLKIGKYCSIANNVNFIVDEGFHSMSTITNYPLAINLFKNDKTHKNASKDGLYNGKQQKEGITIGNDVWIGMGAYIMSGITIGNGVTIAANTVVTRDVPSYVVVAGVPGKIIRKKYSDEISGKMNKIAWWNWNEKDVKKNINFFHGSVEEFVERFYK
tara:strand:+ start:1749 stop:2384 length:636 start_codon:yes stop_codon:yes gene_type:complete